MRNASDVIAILGADGSVRYADPAVRRVLGHEPEDLVSEDALSRVHPDDLGAVLEACAEGLGSPGIAVGPMRSGFRHADGSWRHLEGIDTNLLGDSVVEGVVVNARDITERVEAEERYRALVELVE